MTTRPARESMTLLEGDESRETRAALFGGHLLVESYDLYRGEWHRDPESGIALPPAALAVLRTLLASTDCDECGEAPAVTGRKCRECENG